MRGEMTDLDRFLISNFIGHTSRRATTTLSLADLESELEKEEGNLGISEKLHQPKWDTCSGFVITNLILKEISIELSLTNFNHVKELNKVKLQSLLLEDLCGSLEETFHIAAGCNKGKTPKVLLRNDASNGNVVDSGRFTALNIEDVTPSCGNTDNGNIDIEIERILCGAGARRARDLANNDNNNDTFLSSYQDTIKIKSGFKKLIAYSALLVSATTIATITYQAALSARAGTYKNTTRVSHYPYGHGDMSRQDSIMTHTFLMFNSAGFIASVAMIIYLLHEFPLKPWPQILILTMFGSYMCLIMAISPHEALALLLLSIPFLLLAAAGKMLGFAKQSSILSF